MEKVCKRKQDGHEPYCKKLNLGFHALGVSMNGAIGLDTVKLFSKLSIVHSYRMSNCIDVEQLHLQNESLFSKLIKCVAVKATSGMARHIYSKMSKVFDEMHRIDYAN